MRGGCRGGSLCGKLRSAGFGGFYIGSTYSCQLENAMSRPGDRESEISFHHSASRRCRWLSLRETVVRALHGLQYWLLALFSTRELCVSVRPCGIRFCSLWRAIVGGGAILRAAGEGGVVRLVSAVTSSASLSVLRASNWSVQSCLVLRNSTNASFVWADLNHTQPP